MKKSMKCLSVRGTDKQEKALRKEAKAKGMTLSLYLRERLFPAVDTDDFADFKASQIETNAQMCKLLYDLVRETKFAANVSARFYKESHLGADERIRKLHQMIFEEGGLAMNEEQKRALMVGFVLPFSSLLMRYYFSAGLLCQQVYNLPEPNFSTMMKYAIATYNSWFSLKLDDFMFAIPAEFSADIYAHTGLQEVTIMTYRQAVDRFVKPPIYRLFPAYLLLSFVTSMSIMIARSREKGNDKQLTKKQALQQHIRGTQLVDDSQRLVKDPIIFLPTASGNLLISDYLCKGHIFLLGSTGTGKSETLSNLIGGILDKHPGIKVIYADRKGEFFSKFGEPDKYILFNPFDARTVGWSLFNEIRFNKHDPYRAIPVFGKTMQLILILPDEVAKTVEKGAKLSYDIGSEAVKTAPFCAVFTASSRIKRMCGSMKPSWNRRARCRGSRAFVNGAGAAVSTLRASIPRAGFGACVHQK